MSEIDVELKLTLELRPPVHLIPQPLSNPPVRVPLGGVGHIIPFPDQPDSLIPNPL